MISFNTRDSSGDFTDLIRVYNRYQQHLGSLDLIHCHPTGMPVIHWTKPDRIRTCDQQVVAIDMLREGLIIKSILESFPADKKYLIFSNSSWDPSIDLGFEYLLINCNLILLQSQTVVDSVTKRFFVNNAYHYEKEKPNLFCSLIGMEKPPRDMFVSALKDRLLFDNYILNYHGLELGCASRHLDLKFDFGEHAHERMFIHNHPLGGLPFFAVPIDIYNSARMSLVVETSQMDNDFHLTEKTIKPLFAGHPFIVFADRHFLKNLRSLGFRTFETVWSEEYDTIEDIDQRIDAIIDLLNNLHDFDWPSHERELEAITNHNRLVFLNIGHTLAAKQMEQVGLALNNCPWIQQS